MKQKGLLGLMLGALAVAACSDQAVAPDLDVAQEIIPGDNVLAVSVCKIAYEVSEGSGVDDGTLGESFGFETTATGGNPVANVTAVAQNRQAGFDVELCPIVWRSEPVIYDDETEITITEVAPEGFKLKSVVFTGRPGYPVPDEIIDPTSNSVTFVPYAGMTVFFKNVWVGEDPPDPTGGGEGCTPGYWKQRHHFDNWVGYSPSDSFAAVFGVDYDLTLLQALKKGGGKEKALGRHAVAALLNTMNDGVDYDMSTAAVIAAVQDAYDSGDYEGTKNVFEGFNEQGCNLN